MLSSQPLSDQTYALQERQLGINAMGWGLPSVSIVTAEVAIKQIRIRPGDSVSGGLIKAGQGNPLGLLAEAMTAAVPTMANEIHMVTRTF